MFTNAASRTMRATLLAAAMVGPTGSAVAGIEVEGDAVGEAPASMLRLPPSRPSEEEALVSPLRTGGVAMRNATGASLLPFLTYTYQYSRGVGSPPRQDDESARFGAARALARAHAFSRNAYRELRKDEVLPWYALDGLYGW